MEYSGLIDVKYLRLRGKFIPNLCPFRRSGAHNPGGSMGLSWFLFHIFFGKGPANRLGVFAIDCAKTKPLAYIRRRRLRLHGKVVRFDKYSRILATQLSSGSFSKTQEVLAS